MSQCIRDGQWQKAVEINGEQAMFCSACGGWCLNCPDKDNCQVNYDRTFADAERAKIAPILPRPVRNYSVK